MLRYFFTRFLFIRVLVARLSLPRTNSLPGCETAYSMRRVPAVKRCLLLMAACSSLPHQCLTFLRLHPNLSPHSHPISSIACQLLPGLLPLSVINHTHPLLLPVWLATPLYISFLHLFFSFSLSVCLLHIAHLLTRCLSSTDECLFFYPLFSRGTVFSSQIYL